MTEGRKRDGYVVHDLHRRLGLPERVRVVLGFGFSDFLTLHLVEHRQGGRDSNGQLRRRECPPTSAASAGAQLRMHVRDSAMSGTLWRRASSMLAAAEPFGSQQHRGPDDGRSPRRKRPSSRCRDQRRGRRERQLPSVLRHIRSSETTPRTPTRKASAKRDCRSACTSLSSNWSDSSFCVSIRARSPSLMAPPR